MHAGSGSIGVPLLACPAVQAVLVTHTAGQAQAVLQFKMDGTPKACNKAALGNAQGDKSSEDQPQGGETKVQWKPRAAVSPPLGLGPFGMANLGRRSPIASARQRCPAGFLRKAISHRSVRFAPGWYGAGLWPSGPTEPCTQAFGLG